MLVICVTAVGALLLMRPPLYEAKVSLRVGQVADAGVLETADVLATRLMVAYGEQPALGVRRPPPFLKRASASRTTAGLVELVAEAGTAAGAVSLLERIASDVQAEHDKVFVRDRAYLAEHLKNVEATQASLMNQYREVSALLDRLKTSDPLQASLLLQEQSNLGRAIADLGAERPAVALKLSQAQTWPTSLISTIIAPAEPSRPSVASFLMLALGVGLVVGVTVACLVDMIAGARRETA